MTALGAALYGGFFILAALWLFITADGPIGRQGQRPERSNSANTSAESDSSSPWLASHSASK